MENSSEGDGWEYCRDHLYCKADRYQYKEGGGQTWIVHLVVLVVYLSMLIELFDEWLGPSRAM